MIGGTLREYSLQEYGAGFRVSDTMRQQVEVRLTVVSMVAMLCRNQSEIVEKILLRSLFDQITLICIFTHIYIFFFKCHSDIVIHCVFVNLQGPFSQIN